MPLSVTSKRSEGRSCNKDKVVSNDTSKVRIDENGSIFQGDDEIGQLRGLIAEMGGLAEVAIARSIDSLVQRDTDLAREVILADARIDALETIVRRHYRDRLAPADLADPLLLDESRAALEAIGQVLNLGPVHDFQRI